MVSVATQRTNKCIFSIFYLSPFWETKQVLVGVAKIIDTSKQQGYI